MTERRRARRRRLKHWTWKCRRKHWSAVPRLFPYDPFNEGSHP